MEFPKSKLLNNRKRKRNEDPWPTPYSSPRLASNIVMKLANREMYGGFGHPHCGSEEYLTRSMYQNITPNFSVTNIKQPESCLRTFTPDGKFLIGFDVKSSNYVTIYNFLGPAAANHLFKSVQDSHPEWIQNKCIRARDRNESAAAIRESIFDSFFEKAASIKAIPPGYELNKECSLITDDSCYLLVGGSRPAGLNFASTDSVDLSGMASTDEYSDNEVEQGSSSLDEFLLDFCVAVIDLKLRMVVCTKYFNRDLIVLTHNQGLYLYKNTLTVFSLKFQTIHVFNLNSFGELQELRSIGRFVDGADADLFNSVSEFRSVPVHRERFLRSLTQQLFYYVLDEEKSQDNRGFKRKLYRSHEVLQCFHISKTQLLDETTILLKYTLPDPEVDDEFTIAEPSRLYRDYQFFVFYDLKESKIIKVKDIYSTSLADMVSSHSPLFRTCHLAEGGKYMTTPGNSFHCRTAVNKLRARTINYGNLVLSHHLTAYCQSFTPTPYLDHNMFSWDSSRITLLGKPRSFTGSSLKWLGRHSKAHNFEITLTEEPAYENYFFINGENVHSSSGDHLFKLIFHPNTPIMISLQRLNRKYHVNLHFRLQPSSSLH